MVNSCNSRSPILLDTPEHNNGTPNGVIEITDSSGHPWSHARRRRLDAEADDVLGGVSPKRARVDVPVIDLTLDNDEESAANETERLIMSMREQVQSSSRRLAELRARREQMMSMLPDNTRRQLRRVISRHRLNHPDYLANPSNDTRTESTRNPLLSIAQGEDGARPIVVDDDDSSNPFTVLDHDDYSLPSCSRVTPSRVFTPNTNNNTRSSSLTAGNRYGRSNTVLHHTQLHDQGSSTSEVDRFGSSRDPPRSSRARHHHRRRNNLREHWDHISPSSRPHANTNQTAGTQSSDYPAGGATINETLATAFPDVEPRQQPRRYPSRGFSAFEQPLQPYYPELLIQGMLSFWNPDTLRHLGEPEEEREDYEALWNLTERLGQVKPKGLSKADMKEIPAFRFSAASKDSSNGSCVVCLMNYSNKEKLRRLPCNHDFHSKCIDRWLKNNRSCPVCRKDVVSKS